MSGFRTFISIPSAFPLIPTIAKCQSIVCDWRRSFGGNLLGWPNNIVQTQPVPLVIRNSNNLMYGYGIARSVAQNAVDTWGAVAPILTSMEFPQGAHPVDFCEVAVDGVNSDRNSFEASYTKFLSLPASTAAGTKCSATSPCRISLGNVKKQWIPADALLQTAKNSTSGAISARSANSSLSGSNSQGIKSLFVI
jgi:hypothetical protein